VNRRRTLRMAVALLAAVAGAQVARAAGPGRAATCCTSHCRHPVPNPGRCCAVQMPVAEPTLLPAPVHADPAPAVVASVVPLPAAVPTVRSTALSAAVGCRGAPPFLLACNLRL
jgi:hypothetical protein